MAQLPRSSGVEARALADGRGFLVTIDLDAASGSELDSAPRAWLHGELLAGAALRAELGLDAAVDDAEVIVRGLAKLGEPFFGRLLGEVACVVWDPAARTLVAATDAWGTRPIYWAARGDRLAVATETRALRALEWVGSDVDRTSIVAELLRRPGPPEATLFRAIRRVPAGHALALRRGQARLSRWFGPRFAHDLAVRTREDFLERFRATLEEAIADRLRGARAPVLLMSGGFDSTALAALATSLARQGRAPSVTACSAIFPGLSCDEEPRIRLVLDALAMPHRVVAPEPRALSLAEVREDVRRHDAPNFFAQRPIFEAEWAAARALGADVVVTGLGGDELTVDWDYQVDLVRRAGLLGLPGAPAEIARIEGLGRLAAAKLVLRALGVRRPRALRKADPALALLRPELRPIASELAERRAGEVGFDAHAKEVRFALMTNARVQSANEWWAREAASAGFTLRSPFQDRRLWELVLGTPAELQPRTFDRGEYKPALVRTTGPMLPSALTSRYWKVTFDEFEGRAIAASLPQIEAALDGGLRPWLAEDFVFERATRGSGVRGNKSLIFSSRVVALETWLRDLP